MYEITFTRHLEKYFKKLKEKPLKKVYKLTLEEIRGNPYSGQQKRGDLENIYSFDMRYQGINDEIAYVIFEQPKTKIVMILGRHKRKLLRSAKTPYVVMIIKKNLLVFYVFLFITLDT